MINFTDICYEHYNNYQFYKVVDSVMQVLHLANLFFETHKPWELKKKIECQKELDLILHITLETLRVCAIIMQPIIPVMSSKLLDKLHISKDCRSWQHSQCISWLMRDSIHEMKYISNEKFLLFQRIYIDKVNLQKQKAAV